MVERVLLAIEICRYKKNAGLFKQYFKAYVSHHKIPFLDIASEMPIDPDLFQDGIHMFPETIGVRAWLTFLHLLPISEEKIDNGVWPKTFDHESQPQIDLPWKDHFVISLKCDCPDGMDTNGLPCLNYTKDDIRQFTELPD